MATIIRDDIPASDFALAETLTALPAVECECEKIVTSGEEAVMPLVWLRGGEAAVVRQTLQDDPTVAEVELLSAFENEQLYRMTWVGPVQLVLQILTTAEATIMAAYGTGEQWTLRMLYPSQEALTTTIEFGKEHGIPFDITTIRHLEGEPAGRYGLSEGQYTALTTAATAGYYDIPREKDLQAVAEELGVSHQALSEQIRRGMLALIEDTLLFGLQSVE
jgi:predicted DNA binding protein